MQCRMKAKHEKGAVLSTAPFSDAGLSPAVRSENQRDYLSIFVTTPAPTVRRTEIILAAALCLLLWLQLEDPDTLLSPFAPDYFC